MERTTLGVLAVCLALAAACAGADESPAAEDAVVIPRGASASASTKSNFEQGAPASFPAAGEDAVAAASPGEPSSPAPAPGPPSAVEASSAGGAAPAPAPTASQASAAAILRRAERAYEAVRTFDADFTQDLTVPLLDSTQRTRGRMFVRRPDRFLMRFTDPEGDVVVADGQYVWLYYPSSDAKQVIRASAANGQSFDLQREFLSDPTSRFDATLNGTESVGGRPAQVLTLVPNSPSGYRRVRIWVDTEDALVRRFEITESNESLRRLELSNLRPNAAVPDQLFRFTPPAGTQVFSQ